MRRRNLLFSMRMKAFASASPSLVESRLVE
jgi:hypothetical protein